MLISASRSSNAWRSFRIDPFAYVSVVSNSSAVIATTELPSCDHTQYHAAAPLKKGAVVCPATATFFALTATIALSCDSRAADFPNSAAYRSLLSILGTSFWMSTECNRDVSAPG
jgi:hypothetical protein